jgi:hypothetical protein
VILELDVYLLAATLYGGELHDERGELEAHQKEEERGTYIKRTGEVLSCVTILLYCLMLHPSGVPSNSSC